MSRRPRVAPPSYTLDDAIACCERIHERRRNVDSDLAVFFPRALFDDEDIDAVVAYIESHRRVPRDTLIAEHPDYAMLVEYQRQRDLLQYKRRLLRVLETGLSLGVPPSRYGSLIGLPSRSAVWNRRDRLVTELRGHGIRDRTRTEKAADRRMSEWLELHGNAVRRVGEMLVDERDTLLDLVEDGPARTELANAIDKTGQSMSPRPTVTYAAAVVFAMAFLEPGRRRGDPADPILEDLLAQGTRLRRSYITLRRPHKST